MPFRTVKLANSLIFKISITIFLVVITVFLSLGLYYIKRFSEEIESNIITQIKLPGKLMNRQLLRYESVADRDVMTELVGDTFVDGIVLDLNKKIFYSFNPEYTGKNIDTIPEIDFEDFNTEMEREKIYKTEKNGNSYITCITPILPYKGAKPFFFSYIKIATNKSEEKKLATIYLFIISSLFAILLSSTIIIFFTRIIITNPLGKLKHSAEEIAHGNFEERIGIKQQDELGILAESFTFMQKSVKDKIEELALKNEELKKANQAKSLFLSHMSHELKTPLNHIIGFTDLMLLDEVDNEKKEYLAISKNSSEHLLKIIDDILHFAKLEYGPTEIEKKSLEISVLVENLIKMFKSKAEKKGLIIDKFIDEELPKTIFSDPFRLEIILHNLIDNSIKFSEKGAILIAVKKVTYEADEKIEFSVQDEGTGFNPEEIDEIFRMFTQGDSSFSRKYGGVGLGLPTSKKLVEKMNGTITASSNGKNQGSRFSFVIELKS